MSLFRSLVAAAAACACANAVAFAQTLSGISGIVADSAGHRVAGARVAVYALPAKTSVDNPRVVATTDTRGFFVSLGLSAGRYLITADAPGLDIRCVVRNVYEGQVRRVVLQPLFGTAVPRTLCDPPAPGLFDPDETSDVYRVH